MVGGPLEQSQVETQFQSTVHPGRTGAPHFPPPATRPQRHYKPYPARQDGRSACSEHHGNESIVSIIASPGRRVLHYFANMTPIDFSFNLRPCGEQQATRDSSPHFKGVPRDFGFTPLYERGAREDFLSRISPEICSSTASVSSSTSRLLKRNTSNPSSARHRSRTRSCSKCAGSLC